LLAAGRRGPAAEERRQDSRRPRPRRDSHPRSPQPRIPRCRALQSRSPRPGILRCRIPLPRNARHGRPPHRPDPARRVTHRAAARACRWALAAASCRPGYGLRVAVHGGPGRQPVRH
jgi:hypothetical protein